MANYQKIPQIYLLDYKAKRYKVGEFENEWVKALKDTDWAITEKVDGANASAVWDGKRVSLNGMESELNCPFSSFDLMYQNFIGMDNEVKFEEIFHDKSAIIYGELYGGKINPSDKGGAYSSQPKFVVFDIQIDGYWLERNNVEAICERMGLDVVPQIGIMKLEEAYEWTRINGGVSMLNPERRMEGVVCRPTLCFNTKLGERIICKIKRRYMEIEK